MSNIIDKAHCMEVKDKVSLYVNKLGKGKSYEKVYTHCKKPNHIANDYYQLYLEKLEAIKAKRKSRKAKEAKDKVKDKDIKDVTIAILASYVAF